MSIVDCIQAYMDHPHPDEDGEDRGTKLLPPLTPGEIADYEKELGCTFTPAMRELLGYCGGFEEGPMEIIGFRGKAADYLLGPFRGRFRQIAPDGFGNFWFHWLPAVNGELGPVYYYQHEGPMLFFQSARLEDFVSECLRFMTPPYASLIDDVHEFRIKPINELNRDLREPGVVKGSEDPEIRDFLAGLPADALVQDFREARVGDGIDLAKLDVIALHPTLPLLAVKPRKGLLSGLASLFGGAGKVGLGWMA